MLSWTHSLISNIATIIELCGVIIVVVAVGKGLYSIIFVNHFKFEEVGNDVIINTGLATALEVLLAAEILKTLIVRTPSQIIEVGALVLIRIFITLIIHWELVQKEKNLALTEKQISHEKKMLDHQKVRQCVIDLEDDMNETTFN